MLSLCELGFGAAISQSLYKPLAEQDERNVSAIVAYYEKMCRITALVTFVLGIAALPFVTKGVETELDINIVVAAYFLFVFHSVVSYILTPKRMLVICDQRMYVVTAYKSIFSMISLVLQTAMLIVSENYLLYLTVRILVLTVEDLFVNAYADKKYPCLSVKSKVSKDYKRSIFRNVKALVWHKVGGVLSRSTDSLLLTYFVGLSGMGKYSNYALIIGTVGAFFDVVTGAVSSSVGNLGAFDRGEKSEKVMRNLYFFNFWMLTVGTCVIVCTLNPFISLWLGKDMLFTNVEMLIIVSSFYFSCVRDPVQLFVSAYGLFRESRFIPILRAVFNLVLSFLFVRKMGVAGVFLGTTLSTVAAPLFGEVFVLYKHGFSLSAGVFCKDMICYILVSVLCVALNFFVTYSFGADVVGIVMRGVCAFCISNIVLLIFYSGNDCFAEFSKLLHTSVKRRQKSKL